MTAVRHPPRLLLLECGRGLAAFAVLLFHANVASRMEGWQSVEWMTVLKYGVDFFFVLSGFIIYHAHFRDFGCPERVGIYTKKRLARLLPVLWVVTAATYGLQALLAMPVDFAQFVRSALPYPSLLPTDPAVVWTLRHEFLFYLLIGIAIWSRSLGALAFGAWFLAAAIQLVALSAGGGADGIASFFLSAYAFQFLLGMGVAALHRRYAFRPSFAPLVAGMVMLVLALSWDVMYGSRAFGPGEYTDAQGSWFTLVLGGIFALVVHGLVCLEERVTAPRALVALGAATYSVYLIHAPANGLLLRFLRPFSAELAGGVGGVILVITGTTAGILLHHLFEAPTGRWLKSKWLGKTPANRVNSLPDVPTAVRSSSGQG